MQFVKDRIVAIQFAASESGEPEFINVFSAANLRGERGDSIGLDQFPGLAVELPPGSILQSMSATAPSMAS